MKVLYRQPRSNDIRVEVISCVRERGSGSLRSATDDGGGARLSRGCTRGQRLRPNPQADKIKELKHDFAKTLRALGGKVWYNPSQIARVKRHI